MSPSSTVINKKFVAKIIENNIYYIKFHDKIAITVQDIKQSYHAYALLSKGKKLKVLVEFGILSTIEDDARVYAERNNLPVIAEVLIMKTIAYRILAIIYFKFRVLKHPVKIQSSFVKGIEWLRTIN